MKWFSIVVILMAIFVADFAFANCDDTELTCLDPEVRKALQVKLQERGLFKGKATGKNYADTEKAVIQFSKENKIKYDGYLNKPLIKALWGVEIDYQRASVEERIDFLKKIKVLKDSASPEKRIKSTKPDPPK